jgi:hypothetical protein
MKSSLSCFFNLSLGMCLPIMWLQPLDNLIKYKRNDGVRLMEEDVSDILNMKFFNNWLQSCYGGIWTPKEVERCLDIFQTLMERRYQRDFGAIYYDQLLSQYGVWYRPVRETLKELLLTPGVKIWCYDVAPSASEWFIYSNPNNFLPVMLIKIIRDNYEYENKLFFLITKIK